MSNKNKNPFSLPDNYFKNFAEDLQIKILEEKIVEYFGRKNFFVVPEKYFDDFPKRISKRINFKNNKTGKLINMLKPFLSVAAGLLVLFGLWKMFLQDTGTIHVAVIDEFGNIENYAEQNNPELDSILNDSFTKSIIIDEMASEINNEMIIASVTEEAETQENEYVTNENEDYIMYIADYSDFDDIVSNM